MVATVIGRFFFILGWMIFLGLFTLEAYAKELTVFGIRKELQMSPQDPNIKDYYISGGTSDGLRTGALLTVIRRLPMNDPSTSRPYGDLHLPVVLLKVVYVEKGVAVARLHKSLATKDRPLVDFQAVLIGDSVLTADDAGYVEEKAPEKAVERAEKPERVEHVERVHALPEKAEFSSKAPRAEVEKAQPKSGGAPAAAAATPLS